MPVSSQWEYLTVLVSTELLDYEELHPKSVNGQELKSWKKIDLNTFLSQLGADHWEMTGTISISAASTEQEPTICSSNVSNPSTIHWRIFRRTPSSFRTLGWYPFSMIIGLSHNGKWVSFHDQSDAHRDDQKQTRAKMSWRNDTKVTV